jgi:hypothetical protein
VGQRTQGFIQVRAAKMCNALRPASGDCIAWESHWTCFAGGLCRPYIASGGGRVIDHVRSILVGYTRSFLMYLRFKIFVVVDFSLQL